MAEGLLDTSDTSQNAEDIGKQYFNNLLWRSFFQVFQMDEYKNPLSCKMHDLVHDLACFITKDEALVMKRGTKSISPGCRYLSVTCASLIDLKTIYEAKKLRSLILLELQYHRIFDDKFFFNVTKTVTRLRALDLSGTAIRKLSDRISRLKHLRFLDLSQSEIITLPTAITELFNLQTLNLKECYSLGELPEGIGNLHSLRYLDINSCIQIRTLPTSITRLYNLQTLNITECIILTELPEGITNLGNLKHLILSSDTSNNLYCIPRGMGRLSNLETLPMFVVAQENGRTIAELRHLNSIRGSLVIKNLHHVKDPNEAMQANLRAKTGLNSVWLKWNEDLDEEQEPSSTEMEVAASVFERLQPHHNLSNLAICNYIGTRLPDWMSSSFPNLVGLTMWDLERCEHLPLGRWPSLRDLNLRNMHAMRIIGEESYGDGGDITFPLLRRLDLCDMPDLEKWHTEPMVAGRKIASFPHLIDLWIESCPKLDVQPCIPCSMETLIIKTSNEMLLSARSLAGLSKLRYLNIQSCGVSSSSGWWDGLQYLTALEKLHISNCDELTCLPEGIMYLPSLHTLKLQNRNLRSLEGGGRSQQRPTSFFTALRDLNIEAAYVLTVLPEWVGGLTSLQKLEIKDCPNLAILPNSLQHLTALQDLRISKLRLLALPDGLRYLTALQRLDIDGLPQLKTLPNGLRHLIALQKLCIAYLPRLAMLPDCLQQLTSLQQLSIFNLPRLAKLPDSLLHLTALQRLHIFDLPRLTMLPDGPQHLTALRWLRISELPQLEMLPDGLRHLTALQELSISSLPRLVMLPDDLRHLSALQKLGISNMPQLAKLPDGLLHLITLQELRISNLPQLVMLPDGLRYLTALQKLDISDLPRLTNLPDGLRHLTALQMLWITNCTQLAMLPNGLKHLTGLQRLEIKGCPRLVRRCNGKDWHKIAHIPEIFI